MKGIKAAIAKGIRTVILTPVLPKQINPTPVNEFCLYLKKLGISVVNFSIVPVFEWKRESYMNILKDIISGVQLAGLRLISDTPLMSLFGRDLGGLCPAGRFSVYINQSGEVYPCKYLPIYCGNIFTDNVREIWHSDELQIVSSIPEECRKCNFVSKCGGGCKARAYFYKHEIESKDPLCFHNFFEKKCPN